MEYVALLGLVLMQAPQAPASFSAEDLFAAIAKGDQAGVEAMLHERPALADSRNRDGATAILWTFYNRHPEIAAAFRPYRQMDIFEASAAGDTARVHALLETDRNLARADSADGFSALGLAVFFNHPDTAKMLIAAGSDVDRASNNSIKVAPLHSAVASGNPELVRLLLAHGARVDPVEFLGATPLHAAAAEGRDEIAAILLAAGADPKLRTKAGKTPAELAEEGHHEALARKLQAAASP